MGGIGHHSSHPYAVQGLALLASLVLPGSVFALLLGAWWESVRCKRSGPAGGAVGAAAMGSRFLPVND